MIKVEGKVLPESAADMEITEMKALQEKNIIDKVQMEKAIKAYALGLVRKSN